MSFLIPELPVEIKPIRNHQDFVETVDMICGLIDNSWPEVLTFQKDSENHKKYEILVTLIQIYETENCLSEFSDPVEIIQFYMERSNLNVLGLSSLILEKPSTIIDILNRTKPLTLEIICKLCKVWRVPAKFLLKPYRTHHIQPVIKEKEPEFFDNSIKLDEPHAYFP